MKDYVLQMFSPKFIFTQILEVLYKIISMHRHLYQFIVKMPYYLFG